MSSPQKSCSTMPCSASSIKNLYIVFCERHRKYCCVCSKILHYLLKPSLNVCKGLEFFKFCIHSFDKNESNMYFHIAYSLHISIIFQGEE